MSMEGKPCLFFSILFNVIMTLSFGEECQMSEYSVALVCDTPYGSTLSTHFGIRSVMECVSTCTNDDLCLSAIFDDSLRICKTNSEALVDPYTNCSQQVFYAALDMYSVSCNQISAIPPGNIFSACVTNSECAPVSDAECRHGKCQCVPGLSHDPNNNICFPDCVDYGTTFQENLGYLLNGFNDRFIDNIFDPVQCMDLCVAETNFTCRTAEIYLPAGYCYLSVDTIATQPTAHLASLDYNLYQRDCALSLA